MRPPNFSKFPALKTDRLLLRKLSIGDVAEIYQLRSDIEVAAFVGRAPVSNFAEAIAYINRIENLINKNECIFWAISSKGSPALIGAICLWNFDIANETVEIGYELLPQFQNKGIMAEAIAAVLKYGFGAMGVKTIVALPSGNNPRSIKLLEKMGFKLTLSNYKHTHSKVTDMRTFILTDPKYNDANNSPRML